MMKLRLAAVLLTLLLKSAELLAGGAVTALVLGEDIHGRSSAVGGAFTAGGKDISAMLYNPAGLIGMSTENNVAVSYTTRLIDTNLGVAAYAHSNAKEAYAVSYTYLNSGLDTFVFSDGSSFAKNSLSEKALQAAYALRLAGKFSGGLSLKYFVSTLAEQYSASAYAADFGFLYEEVAGYFSLGASLRNAGNGFKYAGVTEPLPQQLRAGVKYSSTYTKRDEVFSAYSVRYILNMSLLADWVKTPGEDQEFCVGIDLDFGLLSLRAGNKWAADSNPAFGIGFKDKGFALDYSYVVRKDITPVHTASITYGW